MKNWSDLLKKIIEPPKTLSTAVDRLLTVLNSEQKLVIALIPEKDLNGLQTTLGKAIRKGFGLHNPSSKLLVDCGTTRPDDATEIIMKEVRKTLTE